MLGQLVVVLTVKNPLVATRLRKSTHDARARLPDRKAAW
jgi:hypothetical protein